MVIIPLGMCSKQVFRTSSSVTAERGFGDDSTEKSNEKIICCCCFFFIKRDKGKSDTLIDDKK